MRLSGRLCVILFACGWALLSAATARAAIKEVRVQGSNIRVNDAPFKIWGLRVAAAANRDEYTKQLIENLGWYKDGGVNALVVFYQGSGGQSLRVFAKDGKSFEDTAVRDRMRQIIDAADQHDMLVIVGLFFPRRMGEKGEDPTLDSREAYIEACRTAAGELKDRHNVILAIADEPGFAFRLAPMRFSAKDSIDCLEAAAEVAPNLPRGCGGMEHDSNQTVAASPACTIIMHNERGATPPKFAQEKPVINISLFGFDSGGRTPYGAWSAKEREQFADALEKYAASKKDHLCANFAGWTEGAREVNKNRFDPGGKGTAADPGTSWFYDLLHKQVTKGTSKPPPTTTSGKSIFDY